MSLTGLSVFPWLICCESVLMSVTFERRLVAMVRADHDRRDLGRRYQPGFKLGG